MKLVIDDFLKDFDSFRYCIDNLEYKDKVSPVDGVTYPGICEQVPEFFLEEIISKLSAVVGAPVKSHMTFLRLSTGGDIPPHIAHNDISMGQFTFMLYCNRPEHCAGGTSFVEHKELGMKHGVVTEEQQKAWERDTNNVEPWEIIDTIKMKTNKGLLFPSNYMHWAQDPMAFGDGSENGRLLLISFFSV